MIYGYTVADAADESIFQEAVAFMQDKLGYTKSGDLLIDVDGTRIQKMENSGALATVKSDTTINFVAIESAVSLPIKCLHKWTET